jgi:L-seryl-tRNA(Ser) seleniumtransferase
MSELRSLPAVDQLLNEQQAGELVEAYGRPLTVQAVRGCLDEIRKSHRDGDPLPGREALLGRVAESLRAWTEATIKGVINATGVILHTNLGRAPLSAATIAAMKSAAEGYSSLEYNLEKGKRGSRLLHAEDLLRRLTGAEAGMVVNNNASAVMLILTGLAKRRAVVIARSQLVEIGGGFRIPDVMKQSGARLVEVGTTNRVHLTDYENAIQDESPVLLLRAHRSNFTILGFTSEPSLKEMADIAHQNGLALVDDLGSGSLLNTEQYGLGHEPMVQESIEAGADLVCFSGDKLLGGPQAGVIAGRQDLVAKLRKHPLARAIRADKICLAGLSATLLHYLKDEAEQEIPVWRMISEPAGTIRRRAEKWASGFEGGIVIEGESTVGGGSLPGETLPTYLMGLKRRGPNKFLSRLRAMELPIIARLEKNLVVFDPRTVLPEQEQALLSGIREVNSRTS